MKHQPQHPIDLLPDSMRSRANASVSRGRNVTYAMLGLVILVMTVFHSRLLESRAVQQFTLLKAQADQLERNEKQVAAMRSEIAQLNDFASRYARVELPIRISNIIATIAEAMPERTSLDRIEINAEQLRRQSGSWRSRRSDGDRALVGELSGFARSDHDIAEFVSRLDRTPPFEEVSLDFSRQRLVRETAAREFRLSFYIDFSRPYRVTGRAPHGRESVLSSEF